MTPSVVGLLKRPPETLRQIAPLSAEVLIVQSRDENLYFGWTSVLTPFNFKTQLQATKVLRFLL